MAIYFDQYQRYKTIQIITEYIKRFYNVEKITILEVGSNEQRNLEKFLSKEDITYSDLEVPQNMEKSIKFIKADATNLFDMADEEYDVVISSDVFEHIPQEGRNSFLSETGRVAKFASIHCFPFSSPAVVSAEKSVNEYYKSMFGNDHIWLKEHIDNGLPQLDEVRKCLSLFSMEYCLFEHGDIMLWESMFKNIFYVGFMPYLLPLRERLDEFYQQKVYQNDWGENNYRVFLSNSKNAGLIEYLKKELNQYFSHKLAEQDWNFIYNCIDDIRALAVLPKNQEKITDNYESTVYFDKGAGYSEDDKASFQYRVEQSIGQVKALVEIDADIKNIRFDCAEGKAVIMTDTLVLSDAGILEYAVENGFRHENSIIFTSADPQIIINVEGENLNWIEIKTKVTLLDYEAGLLIFNELTNLLEKTSILSEQNGSSKIEILELKYKYEQRDQEAISVLSKLQGKYEQRDQEAIRLLCELQDKEKEIIQLCNKIEDRENELSLLIEKSEKSEENDNKILSQLDEVNERNKSIISELEYYKLHYHAAINQRTELTNQLSQAHKEYSAVMESHCWKITLPIRVVTQFVRRFFGSNRVFKLIKEGMKSLLEHGFIYTWNRVWKKICRKYSGNKYLNRNCLSKEQRRLEETTIFSEEIKFSIIVPLYNTPITYLEEMIESCKSQTYSNWELCMADGSDEDHSNVEQTVLKLAKKDNRLKYNRIGRNCGISENTNAAINMAEGEYIALFDHDDVLHPSALFEYMKAICNEGADFLYCDEDKFKDDITKCFELFFKPDFAIDNLRANNYICHFTVFKRSLLKEVGMFRKEFDGSQDHDMILRLTERAESIVHIPRILYHWRVSSNSVSIDPYAKPYTIQAGIDAVREHLRRCRINAVVESNSFHPNFYRIKYRIEENPLISIIIPNKDHIADLSRCLDSILNRSTYKNIEIIIIENNSTDPDTFAYYKTFEDSSNIYVKFYNSEGVFNFSAINNFGVTHAKGEYLLFLNNDIEIISEAWLEEMLMLAQRNDVGAVGAKLYYPNDTLQHAGVILGIGGVAGHSHKYFPRESVGYFCRCCIQQDLSAVTAACMLMRTTVFHEVGGFNDIDFKVAFNDIDLCMKIRRKGYLIAWTPYAEAYHYESVSRGAEDTIDKQERFKKEIDAFQKKWRKELEEGDPYYNVNLTLDREDFSLKM